MKGGEWVEGRGNGGCRIGGWGCRGVRSRKMQPGRREERGGSRRGEAGRR